MAKCQFCGKTVAYPYRCKYCGGLFCEDHRLPPSHNCINIDAWRKKTPPTISRKSTSRSKYLHPGPPPPSHDFERVEDKVKRIRMKKRIEKIVIVLFISLIIIVTHPEPILTWLDSGSSGGSYISPYVSTSKSSQEQEYIPTPTPTPKETPIFDPCSSGYWRYDLKSALKCALSPEELEKVSELASTLKGSSLSESAWNILAWEDENIDYDWDKASLPNPIIEWRNGKFSVVSGKNNTYQTPYETINRGRGVCSDYSILTAGLLLEMGYSPVYVLNIDFEDYYSGHTATAVKINGEYFVIDQHLPVMDLPTYYKHWAYYESPSKNISTAKVYEIKLEDGNVSAKVVGTLNSSDFKTGDYKFSEKDRLKIQSDLFEAFEENYPNLRRDRTIMDLENREYLPRGYLSGITWTFEFPYYADYYNPAFHSQFVEYMFDQIVDDISTDLNKNNSFWIKVETKENDLVVALNLATR